MKIQHTHPEYASREARMERLKDVRRDCLELLRRLRADQAQRSAL